MQCKCGEAKLVTVKKPGPNTGRRFYACAKPQGSQCDFFCWEGETPRQVKDRGETDGLQSKALAQIQAKINTLEENQKTIIEMLMSIGGRTQSEPVNKKVPF